MKVYLAGSCGSDRRTHMVEIGKALRKVGFEVYCPFELQIPNAWDMSQEAWATKVFIADTQAIDSSDVVVLISPGRISTAGTNWEQGYAYAKGKRVVVFQYTEEATSLMTYCGCHSFVGLKDECVKMPTTTAREIAAKVEEIITCDKVIDELRTILT